MSYPTMPSLNPCCAPRPLANPSETDEWLPASRAKEFSPSHYDFVWSPDYSRFMVFPLRWTDDASYARYQSGAEMDNPRGKGPWVVWHKESCAKVRNGRDQEALLTKAGYRRVAQFASHAEADAAADAGFGGRLNPSDAERRAELAWHESHEEDPVPVHDRYATVQVRVDDGGGAWHYEMMRPKDARRYRERNFGRDANPKLLVLNPSGSSVERAAEKKLGRRLTSAESRNLAQAVKEYRVFHGRDPESIVPVAVPNGTPKFVNLVGDVDRVDYTVKANSDRKGRWTHKAGDHGRTAKKTIPAFLVSIPGKKAPPVFAQRANSKMFFKPSHGIMG